MTSIFIDTSAFLALDYPESDRHQGAKEILDQISPQFDLVTTDYVIDETYTGLLTRAGYSYAMVFDKSLSLGKWKIEKIDVYRFAKAQAVFRLFNRDKKWSFTDCTSYVVMKELKIPSVFAFDENFSQMGFKIL